jgi:hypothetical protein
MYTYIKMHSLTYSLTHSHVASPYTLHSFTDSFLYNLDTHSLTHSLIYTYT